MWVDDDVITHLRRELKERRRTQGVGYNFPQTELVPLINQYAEEQEAAAEKRVRMIVQHIQKTLPDLSQTDLEKLERELLYNEDVRRFLRNP